MLEVEPGWGDKTALTEKASRLLVDRAVGGPSSIADRMIDWMPTGLMKY